MSNGQVGAIFRTCASSRQTLPLVLIRALENIRSAKHAGLSPILFVIPRDHDCGETADCLRRAASRDDSIIVMQTSGELESVLLLKRAFTQLQFYGIEYAAVVSHQGARYLNRTMVQKAQKAFERGRKVVGVMLPGRNNALPISNECAFWHIDTLFNVGAFKNVCGLFELVTLLRIEFNYESCTSVIAVSQKKATSTEERIDASRMQHEYAHVARISTTLRMIVNDIEFL